MVCVAQVPTSWSGAFCRGCNAWFGENHPILPVFLLRFLQVPIKIWVDSGWDYRVAPLTSVPNQITSDNRTQIPVLRALNIYWELYKYILDIVNSYCYLFSYLNYKLLQAQDYLAQKRHLLSEALYCCFSRS